MFFDHDYCHSKRRLRVIYILYHGRRVHDVIAEENGYCRHFDFETDCKEIEKFMYMLSGSGGSIKELQAPHLAKPGTSTYWIHQDARFKRGTRPINITRRERPIKFNGDPNPFNNGRQFYASSYCKICNRYYDEDDCPDHHTVNDNGELIYFDGSKAE